jgi:hypothetical protein
MKKLTLIATLIIGANSVFAMDEDGWASTYESLSAFQSDNTFNPYANRPGYVKPIIDNLGNVLNSNWYVSASVPQSFTFEAGLPLSIISIGNDDQNYSETYTEPFTGISGEYETPTIFGDHGDPYNYDGRVYGNKTLHALPLFSYPYLQLGASMFHARVVFRGMLFPAISELRKFNLFGFGLQYSFGHFFQYMLPPAAQPLDVSLVFGYNTSGIGYRPEDYEGQLDLDISTTNFSLVIGYKPINFIEVMMSLGYQSAEMKSSGNLLCVAKEYGQPTEDFGKTITPDITVKGNNGFRFSLAVAFQLGKAFHPVIGFDYAGKSSFTTNILYFKQQFGEDKTPGEIASEKGYVRGAASNGSADNNVTETETYTSSTTTQEEDGFSDPADDYSGSSSEATYEEMDYPTTDSSEDF